MADSQHRPIGSIEAIWLKNAVEFYTHLLKDLGTMFYRTADESILINFVVAELIHDHIISMFLLCADLWDFC